MLFKKYSLLGICNPEPKSIGFVILLFLTSCQSGTPLFEALKTDKTNISFENKLTESEQMNILGYEYFYNGGGVAAADFNNDGLTDLYFSGNQVPNKLYLNKGNLQFEEVKNSGAEGRPDSWKTGVAIADVNNDGWLDIYQCYSGPGSNEKRKNELFINQGKWSNNSSPTGGGGGFSDQAEEFGIADIGYSTHATFFDYDLDGDLDLFVLNHNLKNYQRKEASVMKATVDELAGDRLYENKSPTPDPSPVGRGDFQTPPLGAGGLFIDITLKSGIKSNPLGFGLGVVVADFNKDNYPDLYVANDYVEEDYLYLNKQNGTFDEVGKEAMGHFSYSSMGVDAADVNNDALPDLFTADMLPEDNARQKLLAFPDNWNVQQSMLKNGFHWQNMRNMLQINVGIRNWELGIRKNNNPIPNTQYPIPQFAELGQLAGVSATDWSWSPLFADFDNDGFKDLFVSNGFVKDLTDLDFVKYYLEEETKANQNQPSETLLEMVKKMPSTPTHHYIFRNNGNLTFENKVNQWGFGHNTVACGSIYADLDNDGDLEIVTNNTNEPATIYKNNQQEQNPKNYLKIKFEGQNTHGAKVYVYTKNQLQYYENTYTHGYQSSVVAPINIGLGDAKVVDSLKIVWPNGVVEKRAKVGVNGVVALKTSPPTPLLSGEGSTPSASLFSNIKVEAMLPSPNRRGAGGEVKVDFNRQILLPRMYSHTGPKFSKGDVSGDGLEDFVATNPLILYLQKMDGTFSLSGSFPKTETKAVDAVLVDIDNDRDLDLYVANGGYEQVLEDKINEDQLWLNNGKGQFTKTTGQIPSILTNKCSVKALDFDNDHDQDLFVGGTVRAGLYPYGDPSYLLRNDGKGRFSIAQKFDDLGLVMDVAIADVNQDGFQDIVLAGEFMPTLLLENNKGKFNKKPLLENAEGWHNRLIANDLDNDGDLDFVVGNLGLNTPLRASNGKPLQLYHGDADGNGTIEPYLANYFGDKAYPIAGRDEALEQWVALRKKFTDYKSYSKATIEEIFDAESLPKMQKLSIFNLKTGILWNNKGVFSWQDLPTAAQASPVYAIAVDDFNHDGIKDILLAGNESNFRIRIGKTDANYGLILLGNKNKSYNVISQDKAGLYLKGDVRDILKIGQNYIFGVNDETLSMYRLKK